MAVDDDDDDEVLIYRPIPKCQIYAVTRSECMYVCIDSGWSKNKGKESEH